jgi:hypothetical protein
VKRRGDGACFFRRGRGLNGSTATGNRKELRHSNMMDRDGKMGEKNVGQGRAGGQETCWSNLFRMRTVAGRSLEPMVSISQTEKRRILEGHNVNFW